MEPDGDRLARLARAVLFLPRPALEIVSFTFSHRLHSDLQARITLRFDTRRDPVAQPPRRGRIAEPDARDAVGPNRIIEGPFPQRAKMVVFR
jgi:hypothetical protein